MSVFSLMLPHLSAHSVHCYERSSSCEAEPTSSWDRYFVVVK